MVYERHKDFIRAKGWLRKNCGYPPAPIGMATRWQYLELFKANIRIRHAVIGRITMKPKEFTGASG